MKDVTLDFTLGRLSVLVDRIVTHINIVGECREKSSILCPYCICTEKCTVKNLPDKPIH
jgi:hypothetical protein